jgi:hypothetical protein
MWKLIMPDRKRFGIIFFMQVTQLLIINLHIINLFLHHRILQEHT